MSFSDEVINKAWERSKEKCENCGKELYKSSKGKETPMGWSYIILLPLIFRE